MKIIFVRHGQTSWNVEKRLQGQTNESKLTEYGKKQAKELRRRLDKIDYDVIISSPLERTMETAKIINKHKQKEIIISNEIIERSYGSIEGEYAISNKYDIKQMWDYNNIYKEYEIEPVDKFFERIYKFFDKLIKEENYNNVLVVSHGGVGIAATTYFEGMLKKENILDMEMKNCEVKIFKA